PCLLRARFKITFRPRRSTSAGAVDGLGTTRKWTCPMGCGGEGRSQRGSESHSEMRSKGNEAVSLACSSCAGSESKQGSPRDFSWEGEPRGIRWSAGPHEKASIRCSPSSRPLGLDLDLDRGR